MSENCFMKDQRASIFIDLMSLEENYRAIQSLVGPGVAVLCVIKADAYGHGAVEVGRRLEGCGVGYFAVASLDEGKELRKNGVTTPILILSGIMPWEDVSSAVDNDMTLAVSSAEALERVAGLQTDKTLKVHVKIDTGMGRLGFSLDNIRPVAKKLRHVEHIEVEGVMSHFASSERRDDYGLAQVESFRKAVDMFREAGIVPKFVHMANSGAICNYPESHFNMVRPGIMLYGSFPDRALCGRLKLKPVMTVSSRIASVRLFPARCALSYGRTYVTERETTVAYVPLGYADGYPRSLSNRGAVLIRGIRCNIIGRVCMDWLLVDVTAIPDVRPGEEVVFLGRGDGGKMIGADEIAEQAGTIPYELLCSISRRVPRRYV